MAVVLITVITGFSIGYGILPLVNQIDQHMSMKFSPAGSIQSMLYQSDNSVHMIVLAIFIVCVLFFVVQVIFILTKVVKPLKQVVKFATKLSRGNFSAELAINDKEPEEIKELIRSLNFMRDRMQSYIGRLQTSRSREQNARRKAESVNSLKGDFLTGMSLELKNPLNSIMGFSRILIKEAENGLYDEELLRKFRIIYQSAESLNAFIEKLFNLSRLDSGEHPVRRSMISSTEFFHDLNEINRPDAEACGVSITTCYSPDQPEKIVVDRDVLMNAMNMILSGMIKTSPENSEIVLGSEVEGNDVIFWIKAPVVKAGCPCVASVYRKNFLRSSATRLSQLSGSISVNLAIAKYSFDMIGGRVYIEGPDENGSLFRVAFDSDDMIYGGDDAINSGLHYATNFDSIASEDSHSMAEPFSLEQQRRIKIGLRFSDLNTEILIEELVKLAGHRLKTYSSDNESLDAAVNGSIDVLLLESDSPHAGVTELIGNLVREADRRPYIVIMATHISENEHQRLIISGADECIEKPLNIDHMLRLFDRLSRINSQNQDSYDE